MVNFFMSFLTSARWAMPINIILAAMIGYSAVQTGLLLFYPPVFIPTSLPSRPALSTTSSSFSHSQANKFNTQALQNAYLFGKAKKITTPVITTNKTLPKTHLNLTLHGIYYSSNPSNSLAMIANASGKIESYKKDAALPGGAILSQIHPKHVILLQNGREEILHLLNQETASKGATRNMVTQSPRKTIHQTPHIPAPAQLLGQYQQQLRTEPQKLMKLFRISSAKQNGRLIGYRIRPRQDSRLLSHFNLQTGDIVTAVNGIPLNTHLNAFNVMQQVATADRIHLQILRNGQTHSYTFQIQQP